MSNVPGSYRGLGAQFRSHIGALAEVTASSQRQAMAALQWSVTATDSDDRVVGGSIRSSFKHLEAEDVEVDVLVDPEGGTSVRVRVQPKVGRDMGMSRADAQQLISEIERTLGPSRPGESPPV
jgi:hypothetical protein